jgi:hypothetical protein
MQRITALAAFALFPSMVSAADRTCPLQEQRTGFALKMSLELKIEDAIDMRNLDIIAWCREYARGYLDAAVDMGHAGGNFVLPDPIAAGQVQDIVLKWAKDHPEKLHFSAWRCVWWALMEAFPKSQAKLSETEVGAAPGANPAYANYTLCLNRRPGCDCARLSKDKVYWDTVVRSNGKCE